MTKFYQHKIEGEVTAARKVMADAARLFKRGSIEYSVEWGLLTLEHVAVYGLPDCYKQFNEFLDDFYPGLSYRPSVETKQIMQLILESDRFTAIATAIQKDWGFNLRSRMGLDMRTLLPDVLDTK